MSGYIGTAERLPFSTFDVFLGEGCQAFYACALALVSHSLHVATTAPLAYTQCTVEGSLGTVDDSYALCWNRLENNRKGSFPFLNLSPLNVVGSA